MNQDGKISMTENNEATVINSEELQNLEIPPELPVGNDPVISTTEELLAQVPESNHTAADVAAMFFMMNEKKLKNSIHKMSRKQMLRMVMAVASYPLIKNEYLPKTDEEKSAAYLFNEMTFNKNIMQLQVEAAKMEEAMKQEQENESNKQSAIAEGEVSNG